MNDDYLIYRDAIAWYMSNIGSGNPQVAFNSYLANSRGGRSIEPGAAAKKEGRNTCDPDAHKFGCSTPRRAFEFQNLPTAAPENLATNCTNFTKANRQEERTFDLKGSSVTPKKHFV